MAQAPIFGHPPAFNVDSWTDDGDGKWTCPVIAVSDRAGLVEILRLCGPERFDEAYAFLAPDDSFFGRTSIAAVLGPHTQQFRRDDRERLDQVLDRAMPGETNMLLVLENSSAWNDRKFIQQIEDARHHRITLILVESLISGMSSTMRARVDAIVVHPALDEVESRVMYEDFFSNYYSRPKIK